MPPKREQSLWEGVWEIAQSFEQSYGLKGLLSGGIVAFAALPPFYREQCVREAKRLTETGGKYNDGDQVVPLNIPEANGVGGPAQGRPDIADAVDAVKYATVHYELLSKEDKEAVDELRRILGPKPKKGRPSGASRAVRDAAKRHKAESKKRPGSGAASA